MDWDATFSTMPNATVLGTLSQAWRWSYAPGFDMSASVSADGEHAFQAYALDSFDEGLAVSLLSFARGHGTELIGPPERAFAVAEGFSHPDFAFDSVVAVGPGIHRCHSEDPDLASRVRALVPAFRCEFAGDEDESELEYRYGRGGVPFTSWGREPHPFMKMRFRGDDGHLPEGRDFPGPGSWRPGSSGMRAMRASSSSSRTSDVRSIPSNGPTPGPSPAGGILAALASTSCSRS